MAHPHHRAPQAKQNAGAGHIELAVVGAGGHHVVRGTARHRGCDQFANQQSRDRRVPVRKVEVVVFGRLGSHGIVVLPRAGLIIKGHSLEARQVESKGILRRHGVDAGTEQVVRAALEDGHNRWVELPDLEEKVGVAHLREFGLLFGGRSAGPRIEAFGYESAKVVFGRVGEWRGRDEGGVELAPLADHQLVASEGFLVEEEPRLEPERWVQCPID